MLLSKSVAEKIKTNKKNILKGWAENKKNSLAKLWYLLVDKGRLDSNDWGLFWWIFAEPQEGLTCSPRVTLGMEKDKCGEVKIQSVFRNDHGCLSAQSGIWLTYRPEERRCRSFCSPRFTATFVLPASATLTLVHKVSIGCQQEPILETNYMNMCYFENLTDYKL